VFTFVLDHKLAQDREGVAFLATQTGENLENFQADKRFAGVGHRFG
jgi:hypothetical protein